MKKVKKILCIHPEPVELRVSALLNRKGLVVDLTEADTPMSLESALQNPAWWDLILCDEQAFTTLDLAARLAGHADRLDASLILFKSPESSLTPAKGFALGAADVLIRGDIDHLLMVCERELRACQARKQLRGLRHSALPPDANDRRPVVLATISDLSSYLHRDASHDEHDESLDAARVRSLIKDGGLVLEYQPIVSFRADQKHRNMFETLVRLRDEQGRILLPGAFLPLVAEAGWMGRIDHWIVLRSLVLLQRMQSGGARDTTLFLNLANQTLLSGDILEAIGTAVAQADLAPGSIIFEVCRSVFDEAPDGLERLLGLLAEKRHGLLVEDLRLDDVAFIETHGAILTHVKLSREIMHGLVDGAASQTALERFVRAAHKQNVRVIALAVDGDELMPMLHAAGIDAIQGNFMSVPHQGLMYPGITIVESNHRSF
ncbi:EAL domain-containing protein [Allochromatium palmeri]|uniref:EAL domain-containing protein n=1 Tax=Allochromatium palmeri TaxID=231048 RepID=A0A6N8EF00_9GAMM|nr:EAL domain-containing protein [Allochromatium palmeri]MTW20914.1 EAL domain-containing protein [Allochromatium palmeri]